MLDTAPTPEQIRDSTDPQWLVAAGYAVRRHPVKYAREHSTSRERGYVNDAYNLGHWAFNRAAMLTCERMKTDPYVYARICNDLREKIRAWPMPFMVAGRDR